MNAADMLALFLFALPCGFSALALVVWFFDRPALTGPHDHP